LYARIKLEKTGSSLGVFVIVATMLSIVDEPMFSCVLQKRVKGTFSFVVLQYFVNCYLCDCSENNELYIRESNVDSSEL